MQCVSFVRSVLALVAFALGTSWTVTSALAQDGAYILEPWSGSYSAVNIQATDQKILATGNVTSTGGLVIARYDSAGNLDTGYGSGGLSTPPGVFGGFSTSVALQPDGKAIVTARNNSAASFGVARFNTNGSLDNSFGTGGLSVTRLSPNIQVPYDVGLQSTGKIVAAGLMYDGRAVGSRSGVLARFNTQGGLDYGKGGFGQVVQGGKTTGYVITTFGSQVAEFKGLAVQPDDKLVAVGTFSPTASVLGQLIVARYTAAGILDTTLNGNGYTVLNPPGLGYTSQSYRHDDVALQSDGKIVVASTCAGMDDFSDMIVARFNTNGTLDNSFAGGSGYVRLDVDGAASATSESSGAVAIQPDGRIVVAGSVSSSVLVVRLNANGTPDATFGGSGFKIGAALPGTGYHSFTGTGLALQSNGRIIVSGYDDQDPTDTTESYPLLMRFNP